MKSLAQVEGRAAPPGVQGQRSWLLVLFFLGQVGVVVDVLHA